MKYFVKSIKSEIVNTEISETDFLELKDATNTLSNFYKINEDYHIVLESYKNIEKTMHDIAMNHVLYNKNIYYHSFQSRVHLNLPTMNYLSVSYYFYNTAYKILEKILSKDQIKDFINHKEKCYDNIIECKFIEGFRDYVQHFDSAFSTLTYNNDCDDTDDDTKINTVTSINITIAKEKIMRNKRMHGEKFKDNFKKNVLEHMPEKIDVLRCIRHHMEGIWRLYYYIITNHYNIAEKARYIISKYTENIKHENKIKTKLYFKAIAYNEEKDEQEDEITLFLGWDDVRLKTIEEMGNLTGLPQRYVSGKIKESS